MWFGNGVISTLEIPLLVVWSRQCECGGFLSSRVTESDQCIVTVFLERDKYQSIPSFGGGWAVTSVWHNKQNSTFHSSWIAHYKYPRDLICWLFAKMYWVPVVDAIDAPLRSPLPAGMCILQLLKVLQLRSLHLWPSRCHLTWRYMEVFTAWPSRQMTEWFMGVQQTDPLASKWDNAAYDLCSRDLWISPDCMLPETTSLLSIFPLSVLLPSLNYRFLLKSLSSIDHMYPSPFLKALL